DFDPAKGAAYAANWGAEGLAIGDIHALTAADLPGQADLAWASFPCQDLSLAGAKAGLSGGRSGAFWAFRDLMGALAREGRAPSILALENVVGALTSNGGADFAALCASLHGLGYRVGAMVLDAADFTPQSRPRLFVVCVRKDVPLPAALMSQQPAPRLTPAALLRARALLPAEVARDWVWWGVPAPPARNSALIDIIERHPQDVAWRTDEQTQRVLDLMSEANLAKVRDAQRKGALQVGALYRRTRGDGAGGKAQRAEVRFDGLAGCLRTPGGGSSRQFLIFVEGARIRTRLVSGREAARLMGLPDDYRLPARYTDAYHLLGDGVAPPVVRHLAENLFEPLLAGAARRGAAA
ncbi:MAG: DNA cytosine methyltransferase, partial [Beijerinckiaceae bacterium]|nr:DNA cytosine methyltransferase [Beijerinckiaceae bacterium]